MISLRSTPKEFTASQKALRVLGGAMLVGVLSIVVFAAHAGGKEGFLGFLAMVSVGVLLAGASAFVGGALGFLFGIPRTLQQEGGSPSAEANPAGAETGSSTRRIDYRVNTNLEQISDWLTKILVGVSLTQIPDIRDGLTSLTVFAAQGLGPQSQGLVFTFALLSYSAVVGFLFGYLWTRLFLVGALRAADQIAMERKVEGLEEQSEKTDLFAGAITALRLGAVKSEIQDRRNELASYLRSHPKDRRVAILLARLFTEINNDFRAGITVLDSFLKAKADSQEFDKDYADALYNRACYKARLWQDTQDVTCRDQAYEDLEKSIEISPTNKVDAEHDQDFSSLREEDRFKTLGGTPGQ